MVLVFALTEEILNRKPKSVITIEKMTFYQKLHTDIKLKL